MTAERVLPDSPGQRAHIQAGDLLTGVSESPNEDVTGVTRVADLERALYRAGPYVKVRYSITRDGIPLDTPVQVIPVPADRSLQLGLRIIGLIYLVIGFYVLFRRWGAPAIHALLSLLPGFVRALRAQVHRRSSTLLDWTVFWTNVVAEVAAAGAVSPFRPQLSRGAIQEPWPPLAVAAGIRARRGTAGLWLWSMSTREATGLLLHRLDQTATAYDAAFYVIAAVLFLRSYSRADSPLLRQQLKWVRAEPCWRFCPSRSFTRFLTCSI